MDLRRRIFGREISMLSRVVMGLALLVLLGAAAPSAFAQDPPQDRA